MAEKCICHLNGYAIKDATARKNITELEKRVLAAEKIGETVNTLVKRVSASLSYTMNVPNINKAISLSAPLEKISGLEIYFTTQFQKNGATGSYPYMFHYGTPTAYNKTTGDIGRHNITLGEDDVKIGCQLSITSNGLQIVLTAESLKGTVNVIKSTLQSVVYYESVG